MVVDRVNTGFRRNLKRALAILLSAAFVFMTMMPGLWQFKVFATEGDPVTATGAAADLSFEEGAEEGTVILVASNGLSTYLNGETTFEIPGTITTAGEPGDTYTVVGIDDDAFKESLTGFTSVAIPDSVTSIGDSAFSGVSGLATVTFSGTSGLKSIGESAFSETGLTGIAIPASVESIGDNAFKDAGSLASVTFGENSLLEGIGEGAFTGTGLTTIAIPDSVESIGKNAFKDITGLTAVAFGENSVLDEIGEGAFTGSGLIAISIPGSVTNVEKDAFKDAASLATVTFEPGARALSIGVGAFENTVLTSITIPERVNSIGSGAFAGTSNTLKEINFKWTEAEDIPDGLDDAFDDEDTLNVDCVINIPKGTGDAYAGIAIGGLNIASEIFIEVTDASGDPITNGSATYPTKKIYLKLSASGFSETVDADDQSEEIEIEVTLTGGKDFDETIYVPLEEGSNTTLAPIEIPFANLVYGEAGNDFKAEYAPGSGGKNNVAPATVLDYVVNPRQIKLNDLEVLIKDSDDNYVEYVKQYDDLADIDDAEIFIKEDSIIHWKDGKIADHCDEGSTVDDVAFELGDATAQFNLEDNRYTNAGFTVPTANDQKGTDIKVSIINPEGEESPATLSGNAAGRYGLDLTENDNDDDLQLLIAKIKQMFDPSGKYSINEPSGGDVTDTNEYSKYKDGVEEGFADYKDHKWYNGEDLEEANTEPQSSIFKIEAKEGFSISLTNTHEGSWGEDCTWAADSEGMIDFSTGEGIKKYQGYNTFDFFIRDTSGTDDSNEDAVSVENDISWKATETYFIDTVAPQVTEVSIEVPKGEGLWGSLLDKFRFPFGYFYNDDVKITVVVKDATSGVQSISLYVDTAEAADEGFIEETTDQDGVKTFTAEFEIALDDGVDSERIINKLKIKTVDVAGNETAIDDFSENGDYEISYDDWDGYIQLENTKPVIKHGESIDNDTDGYDVSTNEIIAPRPSDDARFFNGDAIIPFTVKDGQSGLLYDNVKFFVNGVQFGGGGDDEDVTFIVTDPEEDSDTLAPGYLEDERDLESHTYWINTSQLPEGDEVANGKVEITAEITDNAGNIYETEGGETEDTIYIDTVAPIIKGFQFSLTDNIDVDSDDGDIEGANAVYEAVEEIDYGFYFKEGVTITVLAEDLGPDSSYKDETSGVKEIMVYLVGKNGDGQDVYYKVIKKNDSGTLIPDLENAIDLTEDGVDLRELVSYPVDDGKIEIEIPENFKGQIYARATDIVDNYPTKEKATIPDGTLYNEDQLELMDEKGFVHPNGVIVEFADSHLATSSIEIEPTKDAGYTEGYPYDGAFDYSKSNSKKYGNAQADSSLAYFEADGETLVDDEVRLYAIADDKSPSFDVTVTDSYSGIRSVTWTVFEAGKDAVSETVTVENGWTGNEDPVVALGGDKDDWEVTSEDPNLITEIKKTIAVSGNANDMVLLIELEDRSGNVSYDYYVFGIDTTAPTIEVSYDNNNVDSEKYFKARRTASITITERNFNPAADDIKIIAEHGSEASYSYPPTVASWTPVSDGSGNKDDKTWKTEIVYSADDDYTFDISTTDLAGHTANRSKGVSFVGESEEAAAAPTEFTIDKTAPVVDVKYKENASYDNNYYNTPRTATITVKEHNFAPGRVEISGTAGLDPLLITFPDLSEWESSDDMHTATIKYTEDGLYTFDIKVTDLAGNSFDDYTEDVFYVDKTAPVITGFEFDPSENIDAKGAEGVYKAVEEMDYGFYFKEDVDVTISATDFGPDAAYDAAAEANKTAGIKELKVYAAGAEKDSEGEIVYSYYAFAKDENGYVLELTQIDDFSIEDATSIESSKFDYLGDNNKDGKATVTIPANFKGQIYARVTDRVENYPTKSDTLLPEGYNEKLLDDDGFIHPNGVIVEDVGKHKETSSITIDPDETDFTQDNAYEDELDYSKYNSGVYIDAQDRAQEDGDLDYFVDGDTEDKKPVDDAILLYDENPSFDITVSDTYSGIRSVTWTVFGGVEDLDPEGSGPATGTVEVANEWEGEPSEALEGDEGDGGWSVVDSGPQNLITGIRKTITVDDNANDMVLLIELEDRAGNVSYDYYVFGIDKTAPAINVEYDNNDVDSNITFKAQRIATVTITERNFNPSADDIKITAEHGSKASYSYPTDIAKWEPVSEGPGNKDGKTWETKIAYAADDDYTFEVSTTDRAGYVIKSEDVDFGDSIAPKAFTVDNTDPVVSVEYSSNSSYSNYYNAPRTATITVTEHNFAPGRVSWNIKDTAVVPVSFPNLQSESEWKSSGDEHTATITYTEDGLYTFDIGVTDLAGRSSADYSDDVFYIDKTAPVVTGFEFNPSENIDVDKAADGYYKAVEEMDYGFYFKEDVDVTISAADFGPNAAYDAVEANKTAGIKNLKVYAVGVEKDDEGKPVDSYYGFKKVGDSYNPVLIEGAFDIEDVTPVGFGSVSENNRDGKVTVRIPANFKGQIYARATDRVENYPTNPLASIPAAHISDPMDRDGFVHPNGVIVEDVDRHRETSSIEIIPSETEFTQDYGYAGELDYSTHNSGIYDSAQKDKDLGYFVDEGTEDKKPVDEAIRLYAANPSFDITVSDTYSGIRSVTWTVFDEVNNPVPHTVTVENGWSGDDLAEALGGEPSGWSVVDSEIPNLITEISRTIEVDGNANDMVLLIELEDRAGNVSYDYYVFGIDKTAPAINVEYDNNDVDSNTYFKAPRTATVTITERNFDPSSNDVKITAEHGSRASYSYPPAVASWTPVSAGSGNKDDKVWEAKIVYAADDDYTFDISTTDRAGYGNTEVGFGDSIAPKAFTVDNTDPVISVAYSNNDALNSNYYAAPRTATVTVNEHNFTPDRVVITSNATDNGAPISFPALSSWSGSGDVHTATIAYAGDGLYAFDIDMKDLAGHSSADYIAEEFYVDQTAPQIYISGVEDLSANNDTVVPIVRFSDTNYNTNGVTLRLTGVNRGVVNPDGAFGASDNGQTFTFSDFPREKAYDDLYTLDAAITDFAGNETTEAISFSVNRFGSVYVFDDSLNEILNRYTNSERDVVLQEINVDTLVEDRIELKVTQNGTTRTLTPSSDYGYVQTNQPGQWSVYEYTAPKRHFSTDAIYQVSVYSEDRATNVNENIAPEKAAEINFAIDKTSPVIAVSDLDTDGRYNVNSKTANVTIKDNLKLEGVEVTLNGGPADYEQNGDDYAITIGSANLRQSIQIKAVDAAGNTETFSADDFLVTTNPIVRWFYNTPLFVGSVAAVAGLAALIVLLKLRVIGGGAAAVAGAAAGAAAGAGVGAAAGAAGGAGASRGKGGKGKSKGKDSEE